MDKLICSTPGVIWTVTEDIVSIKFKNLTIDFPSELFSDMSFVKWGQSILWQILEQANGHRYQEFVPITEAISIFNPRLEEVKALLDQIKFK